MDGLSVAASLVAVVQLSAQVFSLCQEYYIGAKQSRDEIQRLSNEVLAIHEILQKISDVLEGPDATKFGTLALLDKKNGPAQQCAAQLQELKTHLGPHQGMRKLGWRALKWPLKRDNVNKIVLSLERYKSTFTLALTTDQANLSITTNTGIEGLREDFANARIEEGIIQQQEGEDRLKKEIIGWLSTTDPSTNHAEQRRKHQPTTGRWLLDSKAMADWSSTKTSYMWLHGTAGCGKTVLSSTVIDHLQAHCMEDRKSALAYYYFDFNEPTKQKAANFLSSVIAQLCSQSSVLPDGVRRLYQRCNNGNQRPTSEDLLTALMGSLEGFEDAFVVADALDECPKDNNEREELLKILKVIHGWTNSGLHLLTTSRRETDIESALAPLLCLPAISIGSAQIDADIKVYVKSELEALSEQKRWPRDLVSEVEETLVRGATGMFRWVVCQLQALKLCLKPSLVRKKLNSLPKDLEGTYARILTEIHEDYREDALTALKWLTFSGRPLMLDELVEALLLSPSRQPAYDPEYRLSDPYDIMQILPGLVSISTSTKFNREEIRLAHFSVKEYLMSEKIQCEPTSYFGTNLVAANQFLTEACLAYILHSTTANECTNSAEDLRLFPLLHYACRYWYVHMKVIMDEGQLLSDSRASTNLLSMQLFQSDSAMRRWLMVHRPDMSKRKPFTSHVQHKEVGSALYYAAYLGFRDAVRGLIDHEQPHNRARSVNALGGCYGPPLCAAAATGYTDICQILIQHGADIEKGVSDKHRGTGTPLGLAARFGRETTARLLIENGADVEGNSSFYHGPAICAAAYNGHEHLVRLLLEHGANVNGQGPDGKTSLHGAARGGHLGVVKVLLEHNADIEARNKYKETPLIRAAINDQTEMTEFLIKQDAKIEAVDHQGFTALHRTVRHGRSAAFAILLQKGAHLGARGAAGETLLHSAVTGDNKEMLENLLSLGADLEAQDHEGLTPLHLAASCDKESTLLVLLDKGANPQSKDKNGQTPLHRAALKGNVNVMRTLISKGADLEAEDQYNHTPLHLAAMSGKENAVRLLLYHDVNIEASNSSGETPLFQAIFNALMPFDLVRTISNDRLPLENLVRLLLENGANIGARATGPPDCLKGWTVLHAAAFVGGGNVVRMLLAKGADVNATDARGITPLGLAAAGVPKNSDIMEELEQNGGVVGKEMTITEYREILFRRDFYHVGFFHSGGSAFFE